MINITFTADPLPSDFSGSLQDFQNRFLLNLRGSIQETKVLTGKIGGAVPITNVGPWLNNDTWYIWNGSAYVPATVKVGGAGFVIQLGSLTTTGSTLLLPTNTQLLQDKDGTIALLSDVYQGRPAVILTTTTPTIDWSAAHNFVQTLSGNTTVKMINSVDGETIVVAMRNNATSYTITWPTTPAIFWSAGAAPVQTASKTDLYTFQNIGGSIFGKVTQNY